MTPSCILVVDDEPSLRILLNRIFGKEGFKVLTAANGGEGLEAAFKERPDLIVLDLNLPDMNGEEVCRKIRQDPAIGATPILILTGKTTDGLSARCLNRGADAYLSKPFDVEDILAHVRALLRRSSGYRGSGDPIERGDMIIQPSERSVVLKGTLIQHLSPKEFEVLKELVSRSPDVVEKKELAVKVWGTPLEQLHPRTMDVHVRRIRRKIGNAGARSLKTIPAIGYQWISRS